MINDWLEKVVRRIPRWLQIILLAILTTALALFTLWYLGRWWSIFVIGAG